MKIRQVKKDKKKYLDLLLLADPQEDMIDKYLEESTLFVLSEDEIVKTVCAVVMLENGQCEIKNIATMPEEQGKGYGKYMIDYVCEHFSEWCQMMYVGTGNSQKTIGFYERCGFTNSHIVKDFFADNYREPIYEDGVLLKDMIYLKRKLSAQIDVKRVVDLALEAGRILLKNGGEIFRVDETMTRICNRFHVDKVDTFMLSHGIFISAQHGDEEVYTKVKHVPLSGSNLEIVAEVNDLSREISSGKVTLEEAEKRLKEIECIPGAGYWQKVLGAGLGSGCFGYILCGAEGESIIAFFIGCLLYLWVLTANKHKVSKIVMNMVGGMLISSLAILADHLLASVPLQIDGIIIGGIMPLIPGMAFVNAIREIADSDFLSGTVRMIDALLVFVYVAIGVGISLSVYSNLLGGGLGL